MFKSIFLNDFSIFLHRDKERSNIDNLLKTQDLSDSKEDQKILGNRIYEHLKEIFAEKHE
jgi:hypothetical protein